MLPTISPMRLSRRLKPFDSSDYLYEIKHDGFRALAYVEKRGCRLVSRNGNGFHNFGILEQWIATQLRVKNAILDGEIVCPDQSGRSIFKNVLFRRGECRFFAFDLLWLNGEDLRGLPLVERKARLKKLLGRKRSAMLYVDHIESQGRAIFDHACRLDLEGIVAKPKSATYRADAKRSAWIKIKNPTYSQKEGRQELFEREAPR
jgi:bifunctional non-homologous end joining protein LigD